MSSSAGGTAFLDRDLLLKGLEDQPWFEKNIPLLEIPDKHIQEVYYYRWQTYKEHLVYTGAQYGYMASEFLNPVSYGAPYGGIVAAAGHHITEVPQTMRDDVNKDTSDWAHEYSFWAATALRKQYLVTGDKDFVVGQLANLVKQYRGWDNHYSSSLGLYWQIPVWDATEYTAASYESNDPYYGGAGFRPTINSYQYGDAIAIAKFAAWVESLISRMNIDAGQKVCESRYRSIFGIMRATSTSTKPVTIIPPAPCWGTREIMGYLPWMFGMPFDESQLAAFSQLKDSQGFFSKFGPTTAEQRSKCFMYEAENCCRWDGHSWPFATSQTLTADYYEMLHRWMYDGYNHSEDYNHSTFVDNILAGLIGLRAQSGETIVVNPLILSNWDYFTVENVAYHGHSITVLWDRTGSVYNRGEGLRVYVDGQLVGSRETIGLIKVDVGPSIPTPVSSRINIAANTQRDTRLPLAFASYSSPVDDPMRAINGIIFRTGIPQNSRWTSYNSPNPKDHFGVDLRKDQAVDNVRLFFYDNSDGVRIPTNYGLQYWTGNAWVTIPGQVRSPTPTSSNAETKIIFPPILTSRLRVEAPKAGSGVGWGLSEFEIRKASE